MDQISSNSTRPPMGRGQRIQAMKELQKKSEAAAQLTETGQFADRPAAAASSASSTSHAPDDSAITVNDEHAYKTSLKRHLSETPKPGIQCWTEETAAAICNGKPGPKGARASTAAASGQNGNTPRLLPVNRQAVWTGPKIRNHTSYKGYELDYLEMMLAKERDMSKMDEEDWD